MWCWRLLRSWTPLFERVHSGKTRTHLSSSSSSHTILQSKNKNTSLFSLCCCFMFFFLIFCRMFLSRRSGRFGVCQGELHFFCFPSSSSQVSMKETSCNIPIISSSCSPRPDSTVEGSHPSGWSCKIRLQLQPQPVALCPLLTIFSFPWTLWTLSLSTPTCLHLRYLWPLPFSVSRPAPSISLSSTLSFLVIPPSTPNNTQPSELSACTFVTDILG